MAIDPQLLAFMPHTVTIHAVSGTNNYGESTYGATRTASAYVEPIAMLSSSDQVDEQHQPTKAYIADTNIVLGEKIVLSDGSDPEVASIEVHTEVVGLEHTVVTFR